MGHREAIQAELLGVNREYFREIASERTCPLTLFTNLTAIRPSKFHRVSPAKVIPTSCLDRVGSISLWVQ